jgi:glycosyltransferase involved in cell wall biosynthesis
VLPRVLVVTYYFPPAGGPGVQRTLKTVRYLRDAGYEPVVLTVEAGAFPSQDASLARDVPEGVEVLRTPAPDPFTVYGRLTGKGADAVPTGAVSDAGLLSKLALWVRANVFLPDARVGWVPFAKHAGRKVLGGAERAKEPFAAVVTSGPPHSVHLVGRRLQRTGVPWVADFRDPWTEINFYGDLPMSGAARAIDRWLERRVLKGADAVTTVSPTWARLLEEQGGLPDGTVHVVHNGVDEADLGAAEGVAVRDDAFALAHVGSFYATRNPEAVWAAVRHLREGGEAERLVIRLVGRVDASVRRGAEAAGVPVEVVPYVPHDEAVREQARAGLLLLSIEPFAADRGMITGKLYEYLASGRPVLGVGPPGGDAAALLDETGGGELFARDDVAGIADAIRRHHDAWAAGAPLEGAPWEAVAPYTRRAQTARLADVIRGLDPRSAQ